MKYILLAMLLVGCEPQQCFPSKKVMCVETIQVKNPSCAMVREDEMLYAGPIVIVPNTGATVALQNAERRRREADCKKRPTAPSCNKWEVVR